MNTTVYVLRHFRQVRRTLFLCIILTCTAFVLMTRPLVLPIFDNTRGAIIEEGGLTIETPLLEDRDDQELKSTRIDIVVEDINYEAKVRYRGESVGAFVNDKPSTAVEMMILGQSRTVDEMSIKMNFVRNNSNSNNNNKMILNPFQLNNNNRKVRFNNRMSNRNHRGSVNQHFEGGNRLFHNLNENPEQMFAVWKESLLKACDGNLHLYASQFVRLKDVTVDRNFCVARAQGGEDIRKVLQQDENSEFYTMNTGCFLLSCPSAVPYYYFLGNINYMNQWLPSIISFVKYPPVYVQPEFTIAIERRDYANLYWTMNDWYSTFLMMSFFEKTPTTTNILLVDAHPKGNLDPVWSTLFQSSRRFSELPLSTTFTDMVWGLQGYNSILNQHVAIGHAPPMLPEFRKFVLSRFKIGETRPVNCSEVSVLFVWRRDYLAHPRNPQGRVQRKIFNEQELVDGIKNLHPTYKVQGIQMDLLSMEDQLRLITQADVLIGMHGAGLAHALMLQKHAAMVELIPSYYGTENFHFADLARWSGVSYLKWINSDLRNERTNYHTVVPVSVADGLIETAVKHICSDKTNGQNAEPLYVINGVNQPPRPRTSQQSFGVRQEKVIPRPVVRPVVRVNPVILSRELRPGDNVVTSTLR